jgi:GNAT superfamily N-acetyltransferase
VLARKGLDPRKLAFDVPRRCDLTCGRVGVFYNRRLAGYMDLGEDTMRDGKVVAYPEWVSVESPFRGKGVGSLLYLATAKWVHRSTGCLMQKSFDTTSHADAVWRRFADKGFAGDSVGWGRRSRPGTRMKEGAMQSPAVKTLWRFVESHRAPEGAEWVRYPPAR